MLARRLKVVIGKITDERQYVFVGGGGGNMLDRGLIAKETGDEA